MFINLTINLTICHFHSLPFSLPLSSRDTRESEHRISIVGGGSTARASRVLFTRRDLHGRPGITGAFARREESIIDPVIPTGRAAGEYPAENENLFGTWPA